MSFADDELLPLSGLQHVVFCERQAALIHVEQTWVDNVLTVQGAQRHARVDTDGPRRELRGDHLTVRRLALISRRLGLSGIADVVEFVRDDAGGPVTGVDGCWRATPVEYKRGKPKAHRADEVQVCAQAICLEEMLGPPIAGGFLFYGLEQRRVEVCFDAELRQLVESISARFRQIVENCETPPASWHDGCPACSLIDACMPKRPARTSSARNYIDTMLRSMAGDFEAGAP